MTAQILNAELTNLVADSKRKHPELRNAADKSLQDLKSISVTSEAQLAADLVRRPHFITPFLIACSSKNSRFASSGAGCIQRLAISKALPKERLKDVIDALRDGSSFGLDVQLKILQTLSALTQNYSSHIRGDLLFGLLQVCSTLQASKQAPVSNSAAATLQQLIASLFEGLEAEDARAHDVPTTATVSSGKEQVHVRPFAHDAFRVFHDLCLLTEGQKPQYLTGFSLPQASGLELIETILTSHALVFDEHREQSNVLRTILMPFIIRSLSERQSFPVTVRILRVLSAVVRLHLSLAPSECEIALSLLNHMLDPDAATPWKRALCMEVFRTIYSDMSVLLHLCSTYEQQEGKKQVLRDNLAIFVRLASEKPAAIGLGQQSSTPMGPPTEDGTGETAAIESSSVAGLISGANSTASGVGISAHLSTVKTAFLDQLDKTDAPPVPDTYLYAIVLTCVNNLSDCLARFILPLTVRREIRGRKRAGTQETLDQEPITPSGDEENPLTQPAQDDLSRSGNHKRRNVPTNPLTLENHKAIEGIRSVAALIESSWPAFLATCSTFLYASLDNDYYRALVRSFQKFTQVAGLLRMATPRDALLTTLGKAAVPANVIAASMSPSTSVPESPSVFKASFLSVDSIVSSGSSSDSTRKGSTEDSAPSLNARNLLCLRALLNIAIALGPTLEKAWDIVCESLQQAEMIMSTSTARGSRDPRASVKSPQRSDTDMDSAQSVASEVNAVQAAATRMFESSADFPDEAFVYLLNALCKLLDEEGSASTSDEARPPASPMRRQHQRRVGSYSSISINTDTQIRDVVIALRKIGDVATLNIDRLTYVHPDASGWSLLTTKLKIVACGGDAANAARKLAAEILSHIVQDTIKASSSDDLSHRTEVQQRCFTTLVTAIKGLEDADDRAYARDFDSEIHHIWVNALKSTIEASGDALTTGWNEIFDIILTAFNPHDLPALTVGRSDKSGSLEVDEPDITFTHSKIGRAAFDTIQLICSDFLRIVSADMLESLVDILFCFCAQKDDLNTALTMTGLFWNISDFVQNQGPGIDLSSQLEKLPMSSERPLAPDTGRASQPDELWLRLLLRLVTCTADPRPEVRNTAVHTLYRIFSNSELAARAWSICFDTVLLRMLDLNTLRHEAIAPSESKARESWVGTTKLMLNGFSELLIANLGPLMQESSWSQLFEQITERIKTFLDLQLRTVHAIVYNDLAKVLTAVPEDQAIFLGEDSIANVWLAAPPTEASQDGETDTAKSYEAYVRCFKELYRLFHFRMLYIQPSSQEDTSVTPESAETQKHPDDLFRRLLRASPARLDLPSFQISSAQDKLGRSVEALLLCVSTSTPAAYGSDVDTMTDLQALVLECIQDVHRKNRKAQSLLVTALAKAVSLPFANDEKVQSTKAPTFVAFAKAAMEVLSRLLQESGRDKAGLTLDALTLALASLAQPIDLKYQWSPQGKAPSIWRKATTTALVVLDTSLEYATQASVRTSNDQNQIWMLTVIIARAIARAECEDVPDFDVIDEDEQFDVSALSELSKLITPALGSSRVHDSTRRLYTSSLFSTSLIHKAERNEYPQPPAEPLEGLYEIRRGRTTNPPPTTRVAMAYHCFSQLLSLVSVASFDDSSEEHIALARAAAPYVILRAALPLKAYIADHSLRGRMPQPFTEREELLFVLRSMRELRTEQRAIPAATGAASEHKRHLVRLYPLVTKALQVAGGCRGLAKDDELIREMTKCLDAVGDEFGI